MEDMKRLWEEREKGGGDMTLCINGELTTAHWCVLRETPFFRHHRTQQLGDVDEGALVLTITDTNLTLKSVLSAMKYIYTDYCFTGPNSLQDFTHYCRRMKPHSLQIQSLSVAMGNISQYNCIECYKLGSAFSILPLQWKAWKQAIECNWNTQLKEMITPYTELDVPLNKDEQTSLHISIEKGYLDQVRTLIDAGAGVNVCNSQGQTPLMLAVWYGHVEVAKRLLTAAADIDACDQYQQTALHKACARGYSNITSLLLSHGANSELMSLYGYTPLHMAATGGHKDVVVTLLKHGVSWQLGDSQWKRTALHMAAMKGDTDLVRLLVQLYDREQVRTEVAKDCLTPLHAAVEAGYCEVIKVLITHGAPVTSRDWEGRTPLHYAARSGNTEAVHILLENGAELYCQDKHRMTCLHLAAARNHTNIVTMLLQYQGCPLNVVDKDGLTALHYAAENRNTNMVRQLLQAGTVPTILSEDGHIAKNLVGKKKHLDTLRFLILVRS